MAKSKKEKKLDRKKRLGELLEASKNVQDTLWKKSIDQPQSEVVYVLPEADDFLSPAADTAAADADPSFPNEVQLNDENKEDEDRVALPSTHPTPAAAKQQKQRKRGKINWQDMKLLVAEKYGADAATLVDAHDGNAEDPMFTVFLKLQPHTVPVPRHWSVLRSFNSQQADREEATGLVPPSIQAIGIDKLRATKDEKACPDQKSFVTCFFTGTPLKRKSFGVSLSHFGDVYHERKWMPKARFTPGRLSQRLRQALGMGSTAPPPWLYSMQRMRRLPPAYPDLRIPGLNAPIPPGSQWGQGQGQWGDPPRAANNKFLFPSVTDEAALVGGGTGPLRWGSVPILVESSAGSPTTAAAPAPKPVAAMPQRATTAPATTAGPTINPVPFQPQSFTQQMAGQAPAYQAPQEYVRVQDGQDASSVTVGHHFRAAQQPPNPPNSANAGQGR